MRNQIITLSALALVVVGLGGYFLSNQASVTALIPAFIGLLLWGAYVLASRSHNNLWYGVLTLLAVLGAGGSFRGVGPFVGDLFGGEGGPSLASTSQTITFVLCLVIAVVAVRRWQTSRAL